jgi:hypothetical protein
MSDKEWISSIETDMYMWRYDDNTDGMNSGSSDVQTNHEIPYLCICTSNNIIDNLYDVTVKAIIVGIGFFSFWKLCVEDIIDKINAVVDLNTEEFREIWLRTDQK